VSDVSLQACGSLEYDITFEPDSHSLLCIDDFILHGEKSLDSLMEGEENLLNLILPHEAAAVRRR